MSEGSEFYRTRIRTPSGPKKLFQALKATLQKGPLDCSGLNGGSLLYLKYTIPPKPIRTIKAPYRNAYSNPNPKP